MEVDYAQCSLRTLKNMRKYHRKNRMNERHHTLFRFINKMVKKRQQDYYIKQESEFMKALVKYLGKTVNDSR